MPDVAHHHAELLARRAVPLVAGIGVGMAAGFETGKGFVKGHVQARGQGCGHSALAGAGLASDLVAKAKRPRRVLRAFGFRETTV